MNKVNRILLPTIYIGVFGVMVMCVLLVISGIRSYVVEQPKYDYTVSDIFMSDIVSVAKEENDIFIKPYIVDNVSIIRYFYDINSDKEKQESSIIYYKDTYLQNKGVDYVSDNDFDVVSVYSGEVISIEDNEIYGKVVTIKHNDNLKTVYSNLSNVLVSVGYQTTQGEIIGTSTKSIIDEGDKSLLHFEVIYKDSKIDPETIYTLNVSQLQ